MYNKMGAVFFLELLKGNPKDVSNLPHEPTPVEGISLIARVSGS